MAVRGGGAARAALRDLLDGGTPTTWLREPYLPPGITADDDGPPVPAPPPAGYRSDATYAFATATADVLGRTHADALHDLTADDLALYRDRSVDLTMRGGTTSGVVYPLAVCEVARRHRVRNVGGASAGAIAAAATAAAELGRTRLAAGAAQPRLAPGALGEGHVHAGFRGLADVVAWLTELDGPGTPAREQHRLASLFQPARATRGVWRVVTALMQGRSWAAARLGARTLGTRWGAVAALLVVLSVVTSAVLLPLDAAGPAVRLGVAAAHLAALTALLVGAVGAWRDRAARRAARAATFRRESRPRPQRDLLDVTSEDPAPAPWAGAATSGVLLAGALAAEVALALTQPSPGRGLLVAVPVALATVTLLVVQVAVVTARFVARAERLQHGILSGATREPGRGRPVVTWLDDTLAELAGQPGRSLTFGDLWFGDRPADDARRAQAADDPRHRLVNLQLVTTDLTQQRAVSFPLPSTAVQRERSGTTLHVHPDDLLELVGPELTARLCPAGGGVRARVRREHRWEEIRVHPLPEPAELPVVLAVRMSMALPVLFTAVRVYRLRSLAGVRDDGGHSLRGNGERLRWPPAADLDGLPVAETAWFSDGGITSNFPVQLFDALLPEWPTFGLNLGPHPDGFEHQDVWLPEDWQSGLPPSTRVGASTLGLLAAVVDTARSWRDTAQTGMPSTRGRVAWVRQRSSEGGTNLFMGRDTVASLALRGAYAGARLRQRFGPVDEQDAARPSWERHRWLRLRVAVRALEVQRTRLAGSVPAYLPLLAPGAGAAAAGAPAPQVSKPLYLSGDPDFGEQAGALLRRSGSEAVVVAAAEDSPKPAPELSLGPPM